MDTPVKEGDIIDDRYRVERVIGTGGMAVVVAAIDLRVPERVAIKLLFRKAAKVAEILLRFEREQEVIRRLQGEHIARMLAGGVYKNAPYMVMEYLQGRDLADLLRVQGPLPIPTACEYMLQVCEAVAEAHSLDIVHRDLKPGNLFLTHRPDGSGCIKVLDFGIAKLLDPDRSADESSLTQAQTVMGSPFYMSPEQMLSAKDVDAATDIWALGVIAFELLTGKLPFGAGSPEQLCVRVLNEDPTPVRELSAHCPGGLEQAIGRCLQRMPKNRPANVGELAASIAPFAPPHARAALPRIFHILDFPGDMPEPEENPPDLATVRDPAEPPEAPTVYLSKGKPAGRKQALFIAFGIGMLALGFLGGIFARGGSPLLSSTSTGEVVPVAVPTTASASPVESRRVAAHHEDPDEEGVLPEAPIELDLDVEAAQMAADRRAREAEREEREARRAEREARRADAAPAASASAPSAGGNARPPSASPPSSGSRSKPPQTASSPNRIGSKPDAAGAETTAVTEETTEPTPVPSTPPEPPAAKTVPPSAPRSPLPTP